MVPIDSNHVTGSRSIALSTRFVHTIWPLKYIDLYRDLQFYILRVKWKRDMITAFSNAPHEIKTRFANLENAMKRKDTLHADRHDCISPYRAWVS